MPTLTILTLANASLKFEGILYVTELLDTLTQENVREPFSQKLTLEKT